MRSLNELMSLFQRFILSQKKCLSGIWQYSFVEPWEQAVRTGHKYKVNLVCSEGVHPVCWF